MTVTAAAGLVGREGQGQRDINCIKYIMNRAGGGGVHVMESLYFSTVTSKVRCLHRGIHLVVVGSSVNTVSHGRVTGGLEWIGKEL